MGLALALANVGGAASLAPLSANLSLWLRADLGITLNGSNVSAWADQSGNGNNVSQSTSGFQPAYNATDANYGGQSSITFNAVTPTFLTLASFVLAQPTTLYVVHNFSTLTGTIVPVDGNSASKQAVYGNSGSWAMFAGSAASSATSVASGTHCAVGMFNGGSSFQYLDASSPAIQSNVNPGANGWNSQLVIGGNSGDDISGTIAEVLIYGVAHSSSQVSTNLKYLAARYGTTWS